ncbi:MAG: hypothetical protein PHV06_11885 [bacterium]|nr:hypothetical protein [bacterium]
MAFLFYADKYYYSMNVKVVLIMINLRIFLFLGVLICLFTYLVHLFGKYFYKFLERNKYFILFIFSQVMMYAHYLMTLKFSYFEDSVQKFIIEVRMYSKFLYFNEVLLFFIIGLTLTFVIIKLLKLIIAYKKPAIWKEVLVAVSGNLLIFFCIMTLLGYLKYILQFENII